MSEPIDYDDLCKRLQYPHDNDCELNDDPDTNPNAACTCTWVDRTSAADAIAALREQVAALQPPEPDAQKKIVSEMADDYDRIGDPEIAAALRSCLSRAEAAERERDALRKDAERYRWKTIDSAPLDNKAPLLLAHFTDGELRAFDFDGTWDYETSGWEDGDRISYYWASAFGNVEEPTHWMEQPEWFSKIDAAMREGKE